MEIVNKVAQSSLVTINLEELYIPGERIQFDISPWLYEGLMLKEKDFREYVKNHDWQQYRNKLVAVHCSADAIVPAWAFMLVGIHLAPFAAEIFYGDISQMESWLFLREIDKLDLNNYKDQRIVIKGCSGVEVPQSAYVYLAKKLQPFAKSIMYGEPCSTVPLFKRKENHS